MRACVRIKSTCFNFVSRRTYCNALFIDLSSVFAWRICSYLSTVDDFGQHHCKMVTTRGALQKPRGIYNSLKSFVCGLVDLEI